MGPGPILPINNTQGGGKNNSTVPVNAARLFHNIQKALIKFRPLNAVNSSLKRDLDLVITKFMNSKLRDDVKLQIVDLALNTLEKALENSSNLKFGDGKPFPVAKNSQTGETVLQSQTKLRVDFDRNIKVNENKVNAFIVSLQGIKENLSIKLAGQTMEAVKNSQTLNSMESSRSVGTSISVAKLDPALKEFADEYMTMLDEFYVMHPDFNGNDQKVYLLDAFKTAHQIPLEKGFKLNSNQDVYSFLKKSIPILDFYFKVEKDGVKNLAGLPHKLNSINNIFESVLNFDLDEVSRSYSELKEAPKYYELGVGQYQLTEANGLTMREDFLDELANYLIDENPAALNSILNIQSGGSSNRSWNQTVSDDDFHKMMSNFLVEVRAEQMKS